MKRAHGFSLVELSIVLILTMLCAGLVVTNSSFLSRASVRAELENLYAVCCYMQQKALMSGSVQKIVFDRQANSYRADIFSHRMPIGIVVGFLPGAKGPPATPNKTITTPITFACNEIVFYPDGVVSSGTLYLYNPMTKSMFALTSGVAQISFLRKYRYDKQWYLVNE